MHPGQVPGPLCQAPLFAQQRNGLMNYAASQLSGAEGPFGAGVRRVLTPVRGSLTRGAAPGPGRRVQQPPASSMLTGTPQGPPAGPVPLQQAPLLGFLLVCVRYRPQKEVVSPPS